MHTKDILAEALRSADLPEMAEKAATGHYHDFLSPLEMPCLQLMEDLRSVGTPAAEAVLARHMNGEFDATPAEADEWAKSPDGKAAIAELTSTFGDQLK